MNDCLFVMENEECIFHKGLVMSQEHIASLYTLRFNNAKGSGKWNIDRLSDYEKCVSNLRVSKSSTLGITSIYGNDNMFLIFYEPDTQNVLGALKSKNYENLQKIEQDASASIKHGQSVGYEKYNKGLFIQNWN